MNYILVVASAFLAALLTLFSGFGLGTLLLPVFALFFPLQAAVAATAIVHFLNNLFKLGLLGKHASWPVVLRFGAPAIAASAAGALALVAISHRGILAAYRLGSLECKVTWLGLVLGALIAVFALVDLFPVFERLQFRERWLPLGGLLSGFFGGLSGHQGALRAAFLARCGLSREAFIGTGVVCASAVDAVRLAIYFASILRGSDPGFRQISSPGLLAAGTLAAFLGSFLGSRLLGKVTMKAIQRLVGALLLALAAAIAAGIV